MKTKIILAAVLAVVMSGCVGMPDSEGWRSSQKDEFLKILETDKYASICDQQALYEKVKESENSQLMTKMLVELYKKSCQRMYHQCLSNREKR